MAVLGVADHNGWAVCVTVAAVGGIARVVDRRRVELIEPGVPSQPYHHETVGMPLPDAEALVVRVRHTVMETTLTRLSETCDALKPLHTIAAMAIRTPPLTFVPVTVAEAHASYPVMCRADGMMYHDALCAAARRLGIDVEIADRGDAIALTAERLAVSLEQVEQFLENAGRSFGAPWRKEHRLAAGAAIGALADRTPVSLAR